MTSIPESDWKQFRKLHEIALDRFCAGILKEATGIAADPQPSNHEAYRRLYTLMREQDRELARMFDDSRHGTSMTQLSAMHSVGLITDEELSTFSEEMQDWVRKLQDAL